MSCHLLLRDGQPLAVSSSVLALQKRAAREKRWYRPEWLRTSRGARLVSHVADRVAWTGVEIVDVEVVEKG